MTAIESAMMLVGFVVCLGSSLAIVAVALTYIWAFDKVLRGTVAGAVTGATLGSVTGKALTEPTDKPMETAPQPSDSKNSPKGTNYHKRKTSGRVKHEDEDNLPRRSMPLRRTGLLLRCKRKTTRPMG